VAFGYITSLIEAPRIGPVSLVRSEAVQQDDSENGALCKRAGQISQQRLLAAEGLRRNLHRFG
jgi:hypothetical protein